MALYTKYTHTVFPLESTTKTYTYIVTWNFRRSSFLTAITSEKLDVLDILCGRKNDHFMP